MLILVERVPYLMRRKYQRRLRKKDIVKHIANKIENLEEINYQVPKELKANLRDYQLTGFKWFKTLSHYEFGGILADEMGLGKTIQTVL